MSQMNETVRDVIGASPESMATSYGVAIAIAAALYYTMPARDLNKKAPLELPQGYEGRTEEEKKVIAEYDQIQQLPLVPWLKKSIRPTMSVYVIIIHIFALIAIPHVPDCKMQTLVAGFFSYMLGCIGITAGSHRLWAHKAYKANGVYRFFVMLCASIANQGTIMHWARDHRVHHIYSETRADPHNAMRGLFFAHIGWLFLKKDPRVKLAGNRISMADISSNFEVVLQQKLNPWWNFLWCFVVPPMVCVYLFDETYANAFLVVGILKYVLSLHATWCVNSFAHAGEHHPYEDSYPAENPIVAVMTMGEGWHNYHHAFPMDYRCSEFGVSAQFNPTKLLIDTCAYVGMVWDRRTCEKQWAARIARKGYSNISTKGTAPFRIRTVA
eukprot:CAMPEP_0203790716 /NCGR_PEP_ID=MMETSP0100_2-20121128/4205_1 /ASSEMBLY_ACC=CAM_ASM_000210 /TAXON_ID=96639 /ORGANISM=" , Strain NY0313808BC1" /LENGTH=383 /DNA_ID=CAMNT_0050693897 /DNA_START=1836 /DNA_END=2984 /DNA_ORIENTATION=-